jgi:hypothetical protein
MRAPRTSFSRSGGAAWRVHRVFWLRVPWTDDGGSPHLEHLVHVAQLRAVRLVRKRHVITRHLAGAHRERVPWRCRADCRGVTMTVRQQRRLAGRSATTHPWKPTPGRLVCSHRRVTPEVIARQAGASLTEGFGAAQHGEGAQPGRGCAGLHCGELTRHLAMARVAERRVGYAVLSSGW